MTSTVETKSEIIRQFQKHGQDTGSCEVQIALLTTRIRQLTEHFKSHRKDHASRRGLYMLIGKRSKLLRYLRDNDEPKYRDVLQKLELRH